jgi:hypothetical protein
MTVVELESLPHLANDFAVVGNPAISWSVFLTYFAALCCLTVVIDVVAAGISATRSRSGSLAYEIAALPVLLVLSYYGFQEYLYTSYEDRIFGYDAAAQHTAEIMAAYQCWNILASLLYTQMTAAVMAHHVVSAITAFAAANHFVHGYVAYCFGVFESSSIWLVMIGVFKLFPALQSKYGPLYAALRGTFAIHFIMIRVVLLAPFSYQFIYDVIVIASQPQLHPWPRVPVAILLGICCVFLTLLQLVWARTIVKGVMKHLQPKKPHQD